MYRQPFHISRGARITIMLTLISVFFISAPLLIGYTSGYRYSFEHGLLSKGSLSVTAKPIDATISVNGIAIQHEGGLENRDKAAINMDSLAADRYTVRIERDGYLPWEKIVDVRSNEASYVRDLTLFLDTSFGKLDDLRQYTQAYLTNGTPSLIVQTEDQWQTKTIDSDVFQRQGKFIDTVDFTQHPSRQAAVIFDFSNAPSSTRTIVAGFGGSQPSVYTLPAFQPGSKDMHWNNSGEPTLYVKASSSIYALSASTYTEIGDTTATVWFVDSDRHIWEQHDRILVQTLNPKNTRYVPGTDARPVDMNQHRVILKGERGIFVSLFTKNEAITLIPTSGLLFDPKANLWYTWSDYEIFSIDDSGSIKPLYRSSQKINDIAILDDYGVIAIASPNGITAFHTRYLTSHTLIEGQFISEVSANITDRTLYAIETNAAEKTASFISRRY